MQTIGFIDYYLDEWHANNYPKMILEASAGEMRVTHAYAMIDSPIGGITTDAWCQKMGIARCESIESLVAQCDCLIVLSPDNCEMHELLCQLPLSSGKRTYVDKTFAPDGEIARRIFRIAQEHGTPCYSTSALRFADEYKDICPSTVRAINAWGPNGFETYAIHMLEPVMMLMRATPKRVMAHACQGYSQLILEFPDGRLATLSNFEKGSPFLMNVCAEDGNQVVRVESDFFGRFIEAMVRFFRTGVVEVPHEETISIMDVRGAGLKALKQPGSWIDIL